MHVCIHVSVNVCTHERLAFLHDVLGDGVCVRVCVSVCVCVCVCARARYVCVHYVCVCVAHTHSLTQTHTHTHSTHVLMSASLSASLQLFLVTTTHCVVSVDERTHIRKTSFTNTNLKSLYTIWLLLPLILF
jgi:hypothetical protein